MDDGGVEETKGMDVTEDDDFDNFGNVTDICANIAITSPFSKLRIQATPIDTVNNLIQFEVDNIDPQIESFQNQCRRQGEAKIIGKTNPFFFGLVQVNGFKAPRFMAFKLTGGSCKFNARSIRAFLLDSYGDIHNTNNHQFFFPDGAHFCNAVGGGCACGRKYHVQLIPKHMVLVPFARVKQGRAHRHNSLNGHLYELSALSKLQLFNELRASKRDEKKMFRS